MLVFSPCLLLKRQYDESLILVFFHSCFLTLPLPPVLFFFFFGKDHIINLQFRMVMSEGVYWGIYEDQLILYKIIQLMQLC